MDARLNAWLGAGIDSLRIRGTYNLLYNAALAVRSGAHVLCIEGVARLDDDLMFLPLMPEVRNGVVLAWPRTAAGHALTEAFLTRIKALLDAPAGA